MADAVNTAYKVLGLGGEAINGGNGSWSLPSSNAPGAWMPRIETLVPYRSGYHLCEREHLVSWLGPTIWSVEWRGEMIHLDDKIVVSQARLIKRISAWNDRSARLFATDCAERVLPIFEKQYPEDDRPRRAIETARRFVNGAAAEGELRAGARAARAAETAAAFGATWAAHAIALAVDADADAWAAARAAANNVAWVAKRTWQTARLFHYLDGGDES